MISSICNYRYLDLHKTIHFAFLGFIKKSSELHGGNKGFIEKAMLRDTLMSIFFLHNSIQIKYLLLIAFMINSQTGEASLVSNTSVACPGEAVLFTCSKPATALRWQVDLPAEFGLTSVQSAIFLGSNVGQRDTFGSGVIMFEAVLVSSDGGTVTSTLINLSEVSVLDGSNVTCTSTVTDGGVIELQQTVIVAVAPTAPLNPRLSAAQNQISSSIVTVLWDSPSSTGGVSVSYVLIISPTPLSGSPVTVETTSAQIIISYNTPYNVNIRAINCVGSSSDMMPMIPAIVTCPSNPTPTNRVTINGAPPLPALVGSTLSFTCNGQTVLATCESNGRWSHDPTTYDCPSVHCSLPPELCNGGIVDYERLNETVLEGTVLTYQCDNEFSLTGPNNINCTNAGLWSIEPEAIKFYSRHPIYW
ncbi:uncharacterized protein LOC135348723 isoform X2 [Halichondria panicea]|uniref:uncharacterized protein LOC135348723 isoform X2 n=1 Tax=Halichondria panicea TaxID=6063 RepID=UPI00312B9ACB